MPLTVITALIVCRVTSQQSRGQSYDHFAVDYEFPNDVHVMSMCRQIDGSENNVSEAFTGTNGQFHSGGFRFTGKSNARVRARGINPYVQEHIDLLESDVSCPPWLASISDPVGMNSTRRSSELNGVIL